MPYPNISEGDSAMKVLFTLRNKLTSEKSLKAYVWYLWY
jgi:hypothetical protein